MGSRLELQTLLEGFVANVYFQPPESTQLSYPCIIYQRSAIRTDHANNSPYALKKEYTLTLIERDPDSAVPDQLAMLPTARHAQFYTTDYLNHNVFTIFF